MEEVFAKILRDASPNKLPAVHQACQEAQALLSNHMHGLLKFPPYELREKFIEVLQLALESKNTKLINHAINGFQQLIRDKSFQSVFETENEEKWLPCQLLKAVQSYSSQPEEVQVEILKVLLQMACTYSYILTSTAVVRLLDLCTEAYLLGSSAICTASQATASQALQSFCLSLLETEAIDKNLSEDDTDDEAGYVDGLFEDIHPVFSYICGKLKHHNSPQGRQVSPLLLQCLHSIFVSLKGNLHENSQFLKFIWQELCPILVSLLGSPRTDKNIVSSQKTHPSEGGDHGRGSGCLAAAPSCQSSQAKTVYSIALELVRLVGRVGSMRPVLESLFHRMLLYPPPQHRLEALKAVKELLKNPEMLLHLGGPPLHLDNKNSTTCGMNLLKIVMDSLGDCCHSCDNNVCYVSVSCVVALLNSLEKLCAGEGIPQVFVEHINSLLQDCGTNDNASFRAEEVGGSAVSNEDRCNRNVADDDTKEEVPPSLQTDEEVTGNKELQFMSSSANEASDNQTSAPVSPVRSSSDTEDAELSVQSCDKLADGDEVSTNESLQSGDTARSSGVTEGPETSEDEQEDLEAEQQLSLEEAARLDKVPRTLLGKEDAGKQERERVERLCEEWNEFAQQERQNARGFVDELKRFLPHLLAIRSSIEIDEALQEFASKYCSELWSKQRSEETPAIGDHVPPHITIANADGIYLATCSSLLLSLKLVKTGYYEDPSRKVPLTEQQFIEEVHGSGVLVYLSATWLAELYQQVLSHNLLVAAGYKPNSSENSALINFLTDIDGLGSSQQGAQQLSDYRRLERAASNIQLAPAMLAGMKFSHQVLTACWETIVEVLSVLVNGTNSCGITSTLGLLLSTEGSKMDNRRARDAVTDSLDGLQKAAKLCNILGLQSRCGAIFAQLAAVSCSSPDVRNFLASPTHEKKRRLKKPIFPGRSKSLRLHTSHILSMDAILSRGLELGSHSPDCWKHVFRCCSYVLEVEHTFFSSSSGSHVQPKEPMGPSLAGGGFFLPPVTQDSEEGCVESALPIPGTPVPQHCSITQIIQQATLASNGNCVLKDQQLQKVIEVLSQLTDRIFEDAARKLNLSALVNFVAELCACSQNQLFSHTSHKVSSSHTNTLLLYRLGDVMLRCARGGRPLLHIMKAWSVAAPHFVEAACHKDQTISKRAVAMIHDIVNALLSTHSELPHFHFNEALFKPFENLLCLELCDTDVQEQIISSICEFVEGCTTEIRSGWRPLFGALRAVRLPDPGSEGMEKVGDEERSRHLRVVLDVFEAFLGTNNVFVFANAAVDCILCLLKHVRGPAEIQDSHEVNPTLEQSNAPPPLDFCLAALKYLEQCSSILSSMYQMPACPVFSSANRIQVHSEPQMVDPVIPNAEIVYFEEDLDPSENFHQCSFDGDIQMSVPLKAPVTLAHLDRLTGVLRVWYLLLEGLAGAIVTCPRRYQPHTMETFFTMLKNLRNSPGPEFAIYCINHLLLPMLQGWLRRTARIHRGWDSFAANFKQCTGLATDIVVEFVITLGEQGMLPKVRGICLMLNQLFLVLTECIAQPTETISRLGCACIRHILMTGGPVFTPELWNIACYSLQRACQVSLHNLRQLMVCFHTDSDNFYGDIGQVKVAARRDCSYEESLRLYHLSHQVFLLDCQRAEETVPIPSQTEVEDNRSYIFLLHPPEDEQNPNIIRVAFRSVVVGLLSHQIILQTLSSLLLQGSHLVPSIPTLLLHTASVPDPRASEKKDNNLPGMLSYLSLSQLDVLLSCLLDSYRVACEFDSRPGLKFLLQKVAKSHVAANLYKQAGLSWTIYVLVFLELCLNDKRLDLNHVNNSLKEVSVRVTDEASTDDSTNVPIGETDFHAWPEEVINPGGKRSDLNPFYQLRECFLELCRTYAEMIVDKEGHLAAADRIVDQPIFFLIASADDWSDVCPSHRTSLESSKKSTDDTESEDNLQGEKDQVYTVATEKTIQTVMLEYKKRKSQHSMPSLLRERPKKSTPSDKSRITDEIDAQHRNSILKDGEARLQVWTQVISSVLDVHLSLLDAKFRSLLPVVFPGVHTLIAYATNADLRLNIASWVCRVASVCGFAGPKSDLTPET